jgi:outer membrane protein with beta-barrel domain
MNHTVLSSLMKKILAALAALSVIFPARAETAADPLATRSGWEVGGQIAQYHYEEPDVAKITGFRGGFVGAYTFTSPNRLFFRVDGRESYGSLKYEGSGSQDSVPDWILEARGVAGLDLRAGGATFSPYLGLGYRYLYDDLRGYSSTGFAGYRRYSNYLYAPLGLTTRVDMGERWVFAPTVELDVFIQGKQKTMLSDANLGFNDVTNTQKHGSGYRVYLMFEQDHLAFGPWMHYWNVQESDVQAIGKGQLGVEPDNWTREIGIEFRYRF